MYIRQKVKYLFGSIILLVYLIQIHPLSAKIKLSAGLSIGGTFPIGRLAEPLKIGIIYPVSLRIGAGFDTGKPGIISNTGLELQYSYIFLKSKYSESTKIILMPLVLSVLYTIPFRENMKPYIKAGGGVVFETLIMHNLNKNNIDLINLAVTIPKFGSGESLNAAVAGSILLYHLTNPI